MLDRNFLMEAPVILTIALLVLAGISKAYMDASADGVLKSHLNKSESWKNKWKNGDPSKGEAFFLSSTVLVAFTDFWHLMQMIFLTSVLAAGFITYQPVLGRFWDFIVASVILRVVFELKYRALKEG